MVISIINILNLTVITFSFKLFCFRQTHEDFKEEPLSRIDNNLNQAKMVLEDINSSRIHCLQQLGQRKQFVHWVKEALEGNIY